MDRDVLRCEVEVVHRKDALRVGDAFGLGDALALPCTADW